MSEGRGGYEHRRRLLDGLAGRVIEVGAGNGNSFPYYPASVERVVAVEPEEHLRQRADRVAASAPVPVSVVDGMADGLPGEDKSFEAGVVALVLCTVPDQERALAELFRVIRPGGELRFYEHVISNRHVPAGLQRLADATFWPLMFGGCHPARDTGAAIRHAGFEIEHQERFAFSHVPLSPPLPHILGVARRPG
jgi:ubiquinone/menaquinone biosynthesis C-methylase UbiE